MGKLIRHSVFENNSSSCHSLSIADSNKDFVLDALYPDENGIITVNGDSYGWEEEKYNSAVIKASYVATQFMYDEDKLDLLKKVIIDQTGAEGVVFNISKDDYIDHESVGIVKAEYDYLRNLIFNKNSWVFTANDNSLPSPMFYDVPLYKNGKNGIEVYRTKPDTLIIFTHNGTEIQRIEVVESVIKSSDEHYADNDGIAKYAYDYFTEKYVFRNPDGSLDITNNWRKGHLTHFWGPNEGNVMYYTSRELYDEIKSIRDLKKLPHERWEKEVVEIRYTIEKI
jgi:hypothetical protein